MKTLRMAMLALLLTPVVASGQVLDSIPVVVEGTIVTVAIGVEVNGTATFGLDTLHVQVGDSLQFVADVRDEDGEPVRAIKTYASTDTSVIKIDAITGLAVVVSKGGPAFIKVTAVRPSGLTQRNMVLRTGEVSHDLEFTAKGDMAQFCAYFLSDFGAIMAMTDGVAAPCPEPFERWTPPADGAPWVYRRTVKQLQDFFEPSFHFAMLDDDGTIGFDPATGVAWAVTGG